jgi:hypothetical protein
MEWILADSQPGHELAGPPDGFCELFEWKEWSRPLAWLVRWEFLGVNFLART